MMAFQTTFYNKWGLQRYHFKGFMNNSCMEEWDKREKQELENISLELLSKLPYDEDLFNLNKKWNHIHLCYQCERKFGCNGTVCDDDDNCAWCAECANAEYKTVVGGGN